MNGSRYIIYVLAILCGALFAITGYWGEGVIKLIEIVNVLAFGEFYIDASYIFFFLFRFFPLVLFQAILGKEIYTKFCVASVYFFSRQKDKTKWFIMENIKLYGKTVLYLMTLVTSCTFFVSLNSKIEIYKEGVILLSYYLIIHSLWLFSMTLLINILSIVIGSSGAFGIVIGIQISLISYFVLLKQMFDFNERENVEIKIGLLKCNPMSHLVLKWHSSNSTCLNKYLNEFNIYFSLGESIVFFSIILLLKLNAIYVIIYFFKCLL